MYEDSHTRMAKVEPALPFDHFSGKLSRNERIVMRTRNGRSFFCEVAGTLAIWQVAFGDTAKFSVRSQGH